MEKYMEETFALLVAWAKERGLFYTWQSEETHLVFSYREYPDKEWVIVEFDPRTGEPESVDHSEWPDRLGEDMSSLLKLLVERHPQLSPKGYVKEE